MSDPSLAEIKEKYDTEYACIEPIVTMQLHLTMDKVRARQMWRTVLSRADLSVLADVLADALDSAGRTRMS